MIAPNEPSDELTSSMNRCLQVIAIGGEARRPQVIAIGGEAQHSQEITLEGEDSSRGRKGCATVPVNDARKSKTTMDDEEQCRTYRSCGRCRDGDGRRWRWMSPSLMLKERACGDQ